MSPTGGFGLIIFVCTIIRTLLKGTKNGAVDESESVQTDAAAVQATPNA